MDWNIVTRYHHKELPRSEHSTCVHSFRFFLCHVFYDWLDNGHCPFLEMLTRRFRGSARKTWSCHQTTMDGTWQVFRHCSGNMRGWREIWLRWRRRWASTSENRSQRACWKHTFCSFEEQNSCCCVFVTAYRWKR